MNERQGQEPQQPSAAYGQQYGGGPAPGGPLRPSIRNVTADIQAIIDTAERAAASIRAEAEDQARRYLEDAQRRADAVAAERVRMISSLSDDLVQQAEVVRGHSERMITALEDAIRLIGQRLDDDERETRALLDERTSWPEPEPVLEGFSAAYETPPPPSAYEAQEEGGGGFAFAPPPPPPPPPPASPAAEPAGEWSEAAEDSDGADREGSPDDPADAAAESDEPAGGDGDETPAEDEASPEPEPEPEPATEPVAGGADDGEPPEEALIKATQLAVAGTERDEIEAVLRKEFGLSNPGPVIDRIMGPAG